MPWEIPVFGTGTDVYHIVQWFFIYSILGWCVETAYMSFCEKKFVNRGFILGQSVRSMDLVPWEPTFLLKPFAGNYVVLYILGSLMATFFEFLVAKLMIHIFGTVWWDYREKPYNYEGIICLESSIAWGFYTVILFAFLHRGVMFLADSYSYLAGCIAGGVLMVYYLVDFTVHLCKAKSL